MSRDNIEKKLLDALPYLKLYALTLTGNIHNADDLLQDTSVKILCNINHYSVDCNFRGWTATIMHNIYVNESKRSSRCTAVSDDALFEVPCDDCFVSVRDILRSVRSLPREQRKPLTLYVLGYGYSEIADKLSIPIGTVKSRIHFARQRLQRLLGDSIY